MRRSLVNIFLDSLKPEEYPLLLDTYLRLKERLAALQQERKQLLGRYVRAMEQHMAKWGQPTTAVEQQHLTDQISHFKDVMAKHGGPSGIARTGSSTSSQEQVGGVPGLLPGNCGS